MIRSIDGGITWTSSNPLTVANADWKAVVFYNGIFVSICENGSNFMERAIYSTDYGVNWNPTAPTPNVNLNYHGLTVGNGIFIGVGYNCRLPSDEYCNERIIRSTDVSVSWNLITDNTNIPA